MSQCRELLHHGQPGCSAPDNGDFGFRFGSIAQTLRAVAGDGRRRSHGSRGKMRTASVALLLLLLLLPLLLQLGLNEGGRFGVVATWCVWVCVKCEGSDG